MKIKSMIATFNGMGYDYWALLDDSSIEFAGNRMRLYPTAYWYSRKIVKKAVGLAAEFSFGLAPRKSTEAPIAKFSVKLVEDIKRDGNLPTPPTTTIDYEEWERLITNSNNEGALSHIAVACMQRIAILGFRNTMTATVKQGVGLLGGME